MLSDTYKKQLKELHSDTSRAQGFGGKVKNLGRFHDFVNQWSPTSILDYGCGKGHVLAYLKETYPNILIEGYDPAIPRHESVNRTQYDCVFCNDVLEHIEPEFLLQVLNHIDSISKNYVWLRIDTKPARKKLSDGRNAHLIIEDDRWWLDMISRTIQGNVVYYNLNDKGKYDIAIEKTNTG